MKRGRLIKEIKRQTEDALSGWNLCGNPFMKTPPPEHIRREVFTDREEEMERLIRAVLPNPVNILVFGTYGVGKTIFVLESLCELSGDEGLLPIYTTLEGETPRDFDATVLFALANAVRSWHGRAQEIYDVLTGSSSITETGSEIGGEVGTGGLMPVSFAFGGKGTESRTIQKNAIPQARHEFLEMLEDCRRKYRRVIIAVDEVDKQEPQPFQSLISGSRATLDTTDCSFIITGGLWATWVTQNPSRSIYGAFGEEIKLEPFDLTTTRNVIVAYLNTVRKEHSDDTWPFTSDAVEYIYERSKGVPRQFNQICYETINGAIRREAEGIDKTVVKECQRDSGRGKYRNLKEDERFIVDAILQHGGTLSNDSSSILVKLEALTVLELYPVLEKLVQQDVLVKRETTRTVQYEIAPSLQEARAGDTA